MKLPAQNVLVTSDLSPVGDSAVDLAFSIAGKGGTVHMVHVSEPAFVMNPVDATVLYANAPSGEDRAAYEDKVKRHFRRLVPEESLARGVRSEVHVLHDVGPANVIVNEAKRLGAEVIVMGTHGRSGLGKVFLGSVATDVMKKASVPVVLVHAPAGR
jgi:nucleotide-binding universal stress UspA family protein